MHLTSAEQDELYELLTPAQQRLVARTGDIAAVLEAITQGAELCPRCGVRDQVPRSRTGLCEVCHKKALTEAHEAAYAAEIAHADYNAAKQRLSRLRRGVSTVEPRPRRAEEYGRLACYDTDDTRPKRHCASCDVLMVDHGEELCDECADRQERREGLRACGN